MRSRAGVRRAGLVAAVGALLLSAVPAQAIPPETLESIVSVLPVWPGHPQGGQGVPPGRAGGRGAPEGSGVVVAPDGLIATAWHVVEPAERIDVRLADGRVLPAELVGQDRASDIALLRVDLNLPPLAPAPRPALAQPVCAIGNAYGLGLSIACGVVSARDVSNAGFNPVEDFVQTDAATNPGSSGGALVDAEGRLVGLLSAIFASEGDSNIGINFAVSQPLLQRVVEDLNDDGAASYVSAGWRLEPLRRAEQAEVAAVRVADLAPDAAAAAAGLQAGDLILRIGARRIQSPRDAIGALALVAPGGTVEVEFLRGQEERSGSLDFGRSEDQTDETAALPVPPAATGGADCPHPLPVCAARQAVFPIESFDPLASAVRIAPDLMVTNRHALADRETAKVFTPAGPREGRVLASAYRGDLALLQVEGLPDDGVILTPEPRNDTGPFFAVGADVARQEVRVFEPGRLILPPADEAPLGRLHVTARMQPGVSGGALLDDEGQLVGIAVGGGEGRYEALPSAAIDELLVLQDAPDARSVQTALGTAYSGCADALDSAATAGRGPLPDQVALALSESCRASENAGQYLEAGRVLGMTGDFARAIELHNAAVAQVPNSINARIALLVSLQLGGRIEAMLPHARWLFGMLPEDAQAQRFAIQSGVWGGEPALAEAAYARLAASNPRQAEAARRFIDNPPPAPRAR
ncbi:trypsin-like peptidase domain-containing protein [Algihabitans albus]|uniref:trypsin-like peptidase domain-containing protein n=1 Tax=Algihabitans albus TaxID=2164067 RepID=UPI000E5D61B0|nr:trypsin-like peptidase domain-containing protein [Algihabitans albus]